MDFGIFMEYNKYSVGIIYTNCYIFIENQNAVDWDKMVVFDQVIKIKNCLLD